MSYRWRSLRGKTSYHSNFVQVSREYQLSGLFCEGTGEPDLGESVVEFEYCPAFREGDGEAPVIVIKGDMNLSINRQFDI